MMWTKKHKMIDEVKNKKKKGARGGQITKRKKERREE